MSHYPRFLPAGDRAMLVEFGDRIDADINQQVLSLFDAVQGMAAVQEAIPTYRSLTLCFDPLHISFAQLRCQLEPLLSRAADSPVSVRHWRVPVCYGGEWGEDLAWLADLHQLTPQQVIDMHCSVRYRVYMIGFMPGFAYLGGLPVALHTPRRASPRASTPASSINIGGEQTAISSVVGPSGWHLLGRTPWLTFDSRRAEPFLFAAGDEISFEPIAPDEYLRQCRYYQQPAHRPQPEEQR